MTDDSSAVPDGSPTDGTDADATDAAATGTDGARKRSVGLPPGTMTDEHKEALREGRRRGRIVRQYLEALAQARPRRGRPITREGLEKRIADTEKKIDGAKNPLEKLDLVQRKIDLQKQLALMDEPIDLAPLEEAFVLVAKEYGEVKKIDRAAWLELDVPKSVLDRAGIT